MTHNTANRKQLTAIWLLCGLSLVPAACESAAGPPTTMEVDSAGIPITTAFATVWGPGEGWAIAEEPVLQIGRADGPGEYLLDGVTAVKRLDGGDIVLGEWTSGLLRRYDQYGVFMWQASGQGEGPGEHQRLMWLGVLAGDSIVTWDGGLRRIQVFGPDGVIGRTMRVEAPWSDFSPATVHGVSERRLVMTFADYREEMPQGVVRWPGLRLATVSLDDGTVAGMIDVPGSEEEITRYPGGQWARTGYQYGKGPEFAVTTGRLAVVDTEAFSIRSVSLEDGSIRRILRRDKPLEPVTEEHVEAYLDWMVWRNQRWGGMSEAEAESFRPSWRNRPMAPTLPVLQSILLDAAGNLWVRPHSLPGTRSLPFEVYTPDGTWLGNVATPAGLAVHELGEDYVLGLWSDEQDVEYVRMYRLEK